MRTLLIGALMIAAPAAAIAEHTPSHKTTTFTVRIENISSPATLKLSNGESAPAPNSPGVWVVNHGVTPLFVPGKVESGKGLEVQAEQGNPGPLAGSLAQVKGVKSSGVFNTPVGDAMAGPALPGRAYEFTFTAEPGDHLHLTTMFAQSNDLFYAPDAKGIALFDAKGGAIQGDLTSRLSLWDAGTEVNQEPGLGDDQAPRQKMPNVGATERKPVALVKDAFTYPTVGQVLRMTITAAPEMATR